MGAFLSRSNDLPYTLDKQLVLYDDHAAIQARTHDTSDFTSASALVNHLQPGDLVQQKGDYITEWFYSHWAVYIGNGEIVHVELIWNSASIVRENMVQAFRGKNVRKNNHMDEFWLPRERRRIVRKARKMVGTIWKYNLFSKNCEHFASKCRYGKEISLQSLGISDVRSGAISFGEYVNYHVKAVKEKCSTFFSWIKRKVGPYLPEIGGGSYAHILY